MRKFAVLLSSVSLAVSLGPVCMSEAPQITLNDKRIHPLIGYGTYKAPSSRSPVDLLQVK